MRPLDTPTELRLSVSPAPAVDAIVVSYNSGALLADCVSALLDGGVCAHVTVVDNASSDQCIPLLRQLVRSTERLRIIENTRNLGFAKACNIGLRSSTAEFVLFVNPDCLVGEGALAQMIEAMRQHPDAAMAGCLIRNLDGSEQGGCRRAVPTPWRSLVRVLKLNLLFPNHPRFRSFNLSYEPLPAGPTPVEAISGAFMFVRRTAIETIGPMDEGYFLHCEDLDWCMRIRRAGHQILFVPHVEATHVKGASSSGRAIQVEWHKHRGMLRFYRKFFRHQYPGLLMYVVFVMVWVRFIAKAGYFCCGRKSPVSRLVARRRQRIAAPTLHDSAATPKPNRHSDAPMRTAGPGEARRMDK